MRVVSARGLEPPARRTRRTCRHPPLHPRILAPLASTRTIHLQRADMRQLLGNCFPGLAAYRVALLPRSRYALLPGAADIQQTEPPRLFPEAFRRAG